MRDGINVSVCIMASARDKCAPEGYTQVEPRDERGNDATRTASATVRVEVPSSVRIVAGTGNGDIVARIRSVDVREGMELRTGNGDIRLSVPSSLLADTRAMLADGRIIAKTGHGSVMLDLLP